MRKKIIIPVFFSVFAQVILFSGIVHASLVDDSFNPDANQSVLSIALQADGNILVGGYFTNIGGQERQYIARLNADGTADSTFNPGAISPVGCIIVQQDNKILVGGGKLVRLNADGSVDSTFNPDEISPAYSIAVQPDGKILVGGWFASKGGLVRLNADGSADPTFNTYANNSVNSIAVQADGRILVGGDFGVIGGQQRSHIARLNADGSADSTFNPGANYNVNSIAVQADGRILVGGDFTIVGSQAKNYIARLNADGSLDRTFKTTANYYVNSIAVQTDSRILVGGWFTSIGGHERHYIARLNVNGTVDTSYNPDSNSIINAIVEQADGKILVGGYFTTMGGQERHYIARLDADAPLFNAKDYLPLEPGTIWKYLKNGKRTVTRVVLNKEVTVNEVKTRPVKFLEENVIEYLTNGKNGITLHRQYQPHIYIAGVGWVDIDVTFIPPVKLAESEVWIGQSIRSSGTAQTVVWPMGSTYYFSYLTYSAIEAEELITVPAGTFDTIRYHESIDVYDEMSSTTRYLAKGIGIVKEIATNTQGETSTYELVSLTRLSLLTPNGGELIPSGRTYDITWESSPDMTSFQLEYSVNDGMTWLPIPGAEHVTDNHYLWPVPITAKNRKLCRIRVSGYNASDIMLEKDVSESPFTIGVVQVTSPNGAEVWTSGELHSITWITNEPIAPVAKSQLFYTKNNGETWLPITTIKGNNPGTYDWIVPPMANAKSNCKVKVILKDSAGKSIGTDISDHVFTMRPAL